MEDYSLAFFCSSPLMWLDVQPCMIVILLVWGGKLFRRFCNNFSESSLGRSAVLQLSCCPRKQGELSENILQTIRNKLPPKTIHNIIFAISEFSLS